MSYEYPEAYEISGEEWPGDSRMIADLFAVSAGVPVPV